MICSGCEQKGITINSFDLDGRSYPLIWGGDAANYSAGSNKDIAKYCFPGTMNSYLIEGKIVFCEALWDGSGVLLANGVGTIMSDPETPTDYAFSFPLPTTTLTVEDGPRVLDYIKSTEFVYGYLDNDDLVVESCFSSLFERN